MSLYAKRPELVGSSGRRRLMAVPALARGKTITGRLSYVRDDRPFGGPAPPAAIFCYSCDRGGEHLHFHGQVRQDIDRTQGPTGHALGLRGSGAVAVARARRLSPLHLLAVL